MRHAARCSTRLLAGMLLLMWLTLFPVGAQSDSLHEAYARYQGAYRSYQEAVQAGKAKPEIDRLAVALKTAQAQYVNLLNQDSGQDSSAAGGLLDEDAVAGDDEHGAAQGSAPSAAVPDQRSRVVRSAEEQEYDSLMGDLYTPDRRKRGPELLAKVRAFLKKVKNPLLKMYATFELAQLEFDLTNDPKRAAVILEAYAAQAPTKEAARLARAKIKVFQQEVVVQKFRGAFGQQVEATKSSWQVFKKSSLFISWKR